MNRKELTALADTLSAATSDGTFNAVAIPERLALWLGMDDRSRICVLIDQGNDVFAAAPIETRHLQAVFGARCRVDSHGSTSDGIFTVIRCQDIHGDERDYFLGICADLIERLAISRAPSTVREVVEHLVELFRAIDQPALKTVQGLWGELAVISEASDAEALVRAWHLTTRERFDFAARDERLEVKTSTLLEGRRHHFGLDQVRAEDLDVCIVSLLTEPTAGGHSIEDLVALTQDRLKGRLELQMRVRTVVSETLGRDWRAAERERFDFELARRSRLMLRANDVPAVGLPLPTGVSRVMFVADLSGAAGMSRAEVIAHGGLWSAAWVTDH